VDDGERNGQLDELLDGIELGGVLRERGIEAGGPQRRAASGQVDGLALAVIAGQEPEGQRAPDQDPHPVALAGQALEALLDPGQDPAPRVAASVGTLAHREVHLRREHDVIASAAQRLADNLLGLAAGVHVGGIDEVDALAEGRVDDADAVVMLGLPTEPNIMVPRQCVHAVRFYEREGILPNPVRRGAAGPAASAPGPGAGADPAAHQVPGPDQLQGRGVRGHRRRGDGRSLVRAAVATAARGARAVAG
jgi:hypothetical protein